jgi:cation:H+ antiporter
MSEYPSWVILVVFAISSGAIWWAGTRLEHYADVLSRLTGMGHAFTGVLLLAAATSLPELATTITAVAVLNDATLAVNNLLGGVAMQTALLVVADVIKRDRGRPLTSFEPQFQLLVQGVGLTLLICIVVAGASAEGKPAISSISGWLILMVLAYVGLMYLVYLHRNRPRWQPRTAELQDAEEPPELETARNAGGDPEGASNERRPSRRRVWLLFAAFSSIVLVGGWFATHSAESIAQRSGLGSAFIGATLLALATSLPELSTTTSAVRRRHYSMAISNIFGSNAFDVTLLVLADALSRDGTILAHAEKSMIFVALVGAAMTCVYVLGILERADRTVLGIGWDSALALVLYVGGMAVLYTMR